MKILQINKYPSMRGGTETVLLNTTRLLEEVGHKVVFFSTDEGQVSHMPTYTIPYLKFNAPIAEKIRYMYSFFYNRRAKKMLEQIIVKEKPDIAHIHLYLNCFSVSILPVLKKHNIPVVMTLHDYRQICPSYLLLDKNRNICEKCARGNYFNCMFTRCSKGSFVESSFLTLEMYFRRIFYKTEKYVDQFICVSHSQFDKHVKFNHKISDKSVVLYNSSNINPRKETRRGDYILYYGRFSREKGLGTLLSVMFELPSVKLKVAGEGIEQIDPIPSNVELLGFKRGQELQDLIYNASYVIMPSEWFETFGLSCLESLSLGTPVVASNIGALPEMVKHKENGFLAIPKNFNSLKETILEALSVSDEDYNALSQNAYESAKLFSDDIYIKSLMDIYTALTNK